MNIGRWGLALAAAATTLAAVLVACTDAPSPRAESGDAPTHTIRHALGETSVPARPQRVVVAGNDVLATALLAGVPVVGVARPPGGEGLPAYLDEPDIRDAADVGWNPVSVESVAAQRPDLVIGTVAQLEDVYAELSELVPVVAFDHSGGSDWKPAVRAVADALGARAAADTRIAEFERRAGRFRTGSAPSVGEVSLLNVRSAEDLRIYTPQWCSGQVLSEAGLRRPAGQRTPDEGQFYIGLSTERLTEADADVMFYFPGSVASDPEEAAAQTAQLRANPLWGQLRAVRAGQAHQVASQWWFSCSSVQAANLILDDLERLLG